MVRKYVKKPIVIEAVIWTGDNLDELTEFSKGLITQTMDTMALIPTLEGELGAQRGDYIIRGIKGEYYPCDPNIFKLTYDEVMDVEKTDEWTSDWR